MLLPKNQVKIQNFRLKEHVTSLSFNAQTALQWHLGINSIRAIAAPAPPADAAPNASLIPDVQAALITPSARTSDLFSVRLGIVRLGRA